VIACSENGKIRPPPPKKNQNAKSKKHRPCEAEVLPNKNGNLLERTHLIRSPQN